MTKPQARTVPYYDQDTKKVVPIPARELAPGIILAQAVDDDGKVSEPVFHAAESLHENPVPRHPPLTELRPLFEWFSRVFANAHHQSVEEWEDGFRADMNFAKEIMLWVHVALIFEKMTNGRPKNPARERELLAFLLACLNAGPEMARMTTVRTALTDKATREAAALFGQMHDPDIREAHDLYAQWVEAHPGAMPMGDLNEKQTVILKRFIARRLS
jgi:hypothetical protein